MKDMRKNKKLLKLFSLIFIIILCSCFQTIVYSALYSTMTITGIAYARPVKDVRITDFKLNNSSVNSTSLYEEYSANTISTKFNLVDSSSSIVFDVEVTNYGSADVGILQLIGDIPTGLSYEIINYNLKDKICDDIGKYNQMAVKTFQIKFTGTPGEYEVSFEFDFRTYHKVTYTDITNNNYPTEVIDCGNLNITFTENLKKVTILSSGIEIGYYDQISSGQTITVNDVSSEIEIKQDREPVARLVNGKIDEVGGEVCIGEECFYIISNDGSTVSMLAKYNLYVGGEVSGSHISLKYTAYGSEATGIQYEEAIGYRLENFIELFPFRGTTAFSNVDTTYSGSIVEGYVNSYNSYLITQGVTPIESRLITKEELIRLGCVSDNYTCDAAPNWVYSTSYWSGTLYDASSVWSINSDSIFDCSTYEHELSFGVRPVIEISVDDIYVPIKPKVVSGDYDTVGSKVCIGEECFYVISSTDYSVTMLAYGNIEFEETPPTQDFYTYASTVFSSNTQKGTNYSDYNGSLVEKYVNKYVSYLTEKSLILMEARLITKDELIELGCVEEETSCTGAPDWVYYIDYWTGSSYDNNNVYALDHSGEFGYVPYDMTDYFGVRPVITISKDYL